MIPHLAMHKDWSPIHNPGEVWTLMKKIRQDNNALQVSSMQNRERTRLMPEPDVRARGGHYGGKICGKN